MHQVTTMWADFQMSRNRQTMRRIKTALSIGCE
ncbi:Uncharacterised protein [Vibrio cholerae]|nr:Uncharacterised protein [Vibrio cholerae]